MRWLQYNTFASIVNVPDANVLVYIDKGDSFFSLSLYGWEHKRKEKDARVCASERREKSKRLLCRSMDSFFGVITKSTCFVLFDNRLRCERVQYCSSWWERERRRVAAKEGSERSSDCRREEKFLFSFYLSLCRPPMELPIILIGLLDVSSNQSNEKNVTKRTGKKAATQLGECLLSQSVYK